MKHFKRLAVVFRFEVGQQVLTGAAVALGRDAVLEEAFTDIAVLSRGVC